MDFEILIDDSLSNLVEQPCQSGDKKHILSLVNDFEDGEWRYNKFQSFVWDNIAETSLSFNERQSLVDNSFSLLTAAARNLRLTDKDKNNGSELAEIALYGLMKHHYKALPVVPKIFYKQNTKDYAKGADSVHIVVDENNDFSLWFGEAKFYSSIEDTRLGSIIESVNNSLATDKLKKENSIITNVNDLNSLLELNPELIDKIKSSLDNKKSIDKIKSKIHIPIFILHQCDITKNCSGIDGKYVSDIYKYHIDRAESFFNKQITSLRNIYLHDEITFHIILFPVPNKEKIVTRFIDNVEHYKGQ
ncbi:DUF1837 domain-containing protein [Vibrio fluvialis]|nr:DUF1837 domain-containing protein [Vibrio fluvialis]